MRAYAATHRPHNAPSSSVLHNRKNEKRRRRRSDSKNKHAGSGAGEEEKSKTKTYYINRNKITGETSSSSSLLLLLLLLLLMSRDRIVTDEEEGAAIYSGLTLRTWPEEGRVQWLFWRGDTKYPPPHQIFYKLKWLRSCIFINVTMHWSTSILLYIPITLRKL